MMRFALLGCGKIAQRHAQLLGKGCVAGARLAAVCDRDPKRAATLAREYEVPAFSNPEEMMARGEVDAVSILTPSGSHAADTVSLAPFGKPVVVEKPMALTLDDADRMIEACDRHRCRLFVVKQNRFNAPVQRLRRAMTFS